MIQGYPQYKQKIVMLITWSGRIILIEEAINNSTNKQYFGLEPHAQFDMNFLQEDELNHQQNQAELKKAKIFRTYEKMVTIQKEIYLFNYVEAQQVERRIIEFRNQKKSLPKKLINDLLGQLLDALYQLHKMNILGRQFSTTNVLEDKNNKIFLMDFGFGPDFYHPDNLILHPPEIITQLYLRNEKNLGRFDETKLYDTKLDSWLLGAFLYNLIRLRPITSHKYPNLTDYYLELLKLQENNQTYISAKTARYEGEGICEFIEKLLIFNSQDRFSFLQIHRSDYVKNLNLPKHSIYEKYYQEHENNRALLLKIAKRETAQPSQLFATFDFKPPQESVINSQQLNIFQQRIPSNLPISSNVQSVEMNTQSNQNGENEIRYTEEETNKDITNNFYYHAENIKNSKYYTIWEYINMELYRCYMLNNTSEVVLVHLDQKFELQDLTSYFLKKMSYLILSELLANLKKEKCPWKVQQDLWKQFNDENKKKTLEAKLCIIWSEKEKELKEIGQKVHQKYINNQKLDAGIKNSLQTDYFSQFNFSQYSSDLFIKQGFRLVTTNLHKYLCQESNVYDEMRVNYYGLILKAVFCHLINRALNYDTINEQFLSLRPSNPDERLTPNDIDEFIHSKENDKPKIKQINFLMNKYFAKE